MPRVTISDIAKKLSVSKATVSMALRGNKQISEETKQKVLETAESMGYRPDPTLAKIASSRWRSKTASDGSTLAFVASLHPDHLPLLPNEALEYPSAFIMDPMHSPEWKIFLPGHLQFKGAHKRSEELGYNIQYFLCRPDHNIRALSNNLFHRGIQGVILSPIFDPRFIEEFTWDKFACVSIADHYYHPPTDFVVPKLSSHMMLAFRELFKKGYRRPGIVLYHERIQHLNNHTIRGVFLSLCETVGILQDVPSPCYIEHKNLSILKEWMESEKPDVVIGFNDFVYDTLRELGYRIPEDVKFVSLATKDQEHNVTGIQDPDFMLGYNGIDMLHQKLRHGVLGASETRMFHTIQSKWIDGKSLPVQSEELQKAAMENQGFSDFMNIFPELKKQTLV